jgi:hypothetical protein
VEYEEERGEGEHVWVVVAGEGLGEDGDVAVVVRGEVCAEEGEWRCVWLVELGVLLVLGVGGEGVEVGVQVVGVEDEELGEEARDDGDGRGGEGDEGKAGCGGGGGGERGGGGLGVAVRARRCLVAARHNVGVSGRRRSRVWDSLTLLDELDKQRPGRVAEVKHDAVRVLLILALHQQFAILRDMVTAGRYLLLNLGMSELL